ncbi:hypothetical protein ACKUB1_11680 [Methanospirillum stamsii]|uniref:Prevent-host-death protein n=1 Tax=Methanospirillum stamsii TaxID=1277351 RepID=A0A2V2N5Z6_9EURY|nr:hypothetical protein [Methanospirillum stamsii]PWR73156.1 hypothetical protein DLD82_11310 [Methanospirillum stamsii]
MEIQTNLQYIFDDRGNKTAVIIPIAMWESMIQMSDVKVTQARRKNIDLLFGALKDSPVLADIEEYSQKTREEGVENTCKNF